MLAADRPRIGQRSEIRTGWFERRASRPAPANLRFARVAQPGQRAQAEDEMTAIETAQAPPPETTPFDALGGSFRGELLQPASPGYDAARRIWNGAIDRRPACIARCTGVA